jgi:hypothetical protein
MPMMMKNNLFYNQETLLNCKPTPKTQMISAQVLNLALILISRVQVMVILMNSFFSKSWKLKESKIHMEETVQGVQISV